MSIAEEILLDFDDDQAGHITHVYARLMALEALVDLIWTERFLDTADPIQEVEDVRDQLLQGLSHDADDPVQTVARDLLEERFESILRYVKQLHEIK